MGLYSNAELTLDLNHSIYVLLAQKAEKICISFLLALLLVLPLISGAQTEAIRDSAHISLIARYDSLLSVEDKFEVSFPPGKRSTIITADYAHGFDFMRKDAEDVTVSIEQGGILVIRSRKHLAELIKDRLKH